MRAACRYFYLHRCTYAYRAKQPDAWLTKLKAARRRRRGVSTGLPTKAEHPGHVWSWDFIHDKTVRGGSLKMLTVLDEYTRECRVIHVDRHINAETVRGIMQKMIERHGPPQYIRSNNGSEFIEKELRAWLTAMKIKTGWTPLFVPIFK